MLTESITISSVIHKRIIYKNNVVYSLELLVSLCPTEDTGRQIKSQTQRAWLDLLTTSISTTWWITALYPLRKFVPGHCCEVDLYFYSQVSLAQTRIWLILIAVRSICPFTTELDQFKLEFCDKMWHCRFQKCSFRENYVCSQMFANSKLKNSL